MKTSIFGELEQGSRLLAITMEKKEANRENINRGLMEIRRTEEAGC